MVVIPFVEKKTVRCLDNLFSDFFPVFVNNAWHEGDIRFARLEKTQSN
jgi:hypothetical protein